ncbi:hypothetical protein lse_0988 [Listeria seeligeri serovar 1/2b str. SLCC3954]|nr:hypothetical protein lse_0988 [Listeria seeligeri serovar 1/2b str. SLCC3954]
MKNYEIGSILSFGNYNWRVLDIKENSALIITENIIEHRVYHDAYKQITWADCALRFYLNGEFYNTFSATEKSKIVSVINKNDDNQWYGTDGGVNTKDSIFY